MISLVQISANYIFDKFILFRTAFQNEKISNAKMKKEMI